MLSRFRAVPLFQYHREARETEAAETDFSSSPLASCLEVNSEAL